MVSSFPFKYFGDGYNFFVAVGSKDVYLTVVTQTSPGCYDLWTGLLSDTIKDHKCREDILKDFACAELIVFHNGYLYILTSDRFVVYGFCGKYFDKVYEVSLKTKLSCKDDLETVMQDLMNDCKGKWPGSSHINIKKH